MLNFAGGRDPVEVVTRAARDLVLRAMDEGWSGPPFDPLRLAALMGIQVSPSADIPDARVVPAAQGRVTIEFNPTRPPGRQRYSIAHEIAHTLFPDCGERVRNRARARPATSDDWQLETLCNLAAGEILMPAGSIRREEAGAPDIDKVTLLQRRFAVSTEAVLIRLARLSDEPYAVFVASRREDGSGQYAFDYVIPSRSWPYRMGRGVPLAPSSPVGECIAIGYTAKGDLSLPSVSGRLAVECIGLPPYPGETFPRVAGFVSAKRRAAPERAIKYLQGSVLEPRGPGRKLVAHLVSDATPNWGGRGAAIAIKARWPKAQSEFRKWFGRRRKLGEVHLCEVEDGLEVATMVCQRGYGPSASPRIRYAALETALGVVAEHARATGASVHMPRLGCGQAGGAWLVVEEIINSSMVSIGVVPAVYDLPGASAPPPAAQLSLGPA